MLGYKCLVLTADVALSDKVKYLRLMLDKKLTQSENITTKCINTRLEFWHCSKANGRMLELAPERRMVIYCGYVLLKALHLLQSEYEQISSHHLFIYQTGNMECGLIQEKSETRNQICRSVKIQRPVLMGLSLVQVTLLPSRHYYKLTRCLFYKTKRGVVSNQDLQAIRTMC